ncbi:MAG: SCO family protein [Oceanospirillaceae bacterium]|nr:SCO family protein [Oceanospirillaceae bacterium]
MLVFIISIPFVPLTLDKELNVPFLDQDGNKNALVFFGFRGCSDVCPATLAILRQLFDSQQNTSHWPQVVFVDIDVHSDSTQASNFAKQFHSSFVGLHIPVEELPEISAKFGLNINQQNDQISHLGKIYLLRRKANDWSLVKIYNPNSYSIKTLKNELLNFSK